MALYVNQPVFFRSLRIKRYGTFDGRTVPPGEGWRFVDDLGIELPPGFFGAEDVTFESSPTAGLAIIDVVANYEGTFELRKAQVRWGRNSGAAAGTDDAVTTHHFIKLASGVPSATWVAADFTAIESAIAAFWRRSCWQLATRSQSSATTVGPENHDELRRTGGSRRSSSPSAAALRDRRPGSQAFQLGVELVVDCVLVATSTDEAAARVPDVQGAGHWPTAIQAQSGLNEVIHRSP